jgi:hypothetical protein
MRKEEENKQTAITLEEAIEILSTKNALEKYLKGCDQITPITRVLFSGVGVNGSSEFELSFKKEPLIKLSPILKESMIMNIRRLKATLMGDLEDELSSLNHQLKSLKIAIEEEPLPIGHSPNGKKPPITWEALFDMVEEDLSNLIDKENLGLDFDDFEDLDDLRKSIAIILNIQKAPKKYLPTWEELDEMGGKKLGEIVDNFGLPMDVNDFYTTHDLRIGIAKSLGVLIPAFN